MFARVVFHFVFESIARTAPPRPGRVAALDHEIGDDAMKEGTVVKLFAGEKNEVVNCFRRVFGE